MKNRKQSIPAIVVGTIVSLLAIFVGMSHYLPNSPVNVNIPAPRIPNPNAFDYYAAAAAKMVFVEQCDEAITPVPQRMTSSTSGQPLKTPPAGIPRAFTLKRPYTMAEKLALIKANEPVFKILHDGFQYECLIPRQTTVFSSIDSADLLYLKPLLVLKIRVLSESRNYNQAIDTCLDGIELSYDLSKGATLMGIYDALKVFSIANIDVSNNVKHLDSKQARAAAVRLEDIISDAVSFKEVLCEERHFNMSHLLDEQITQARLPTDRFNYENNRSAEEMLLLQLALRAYKLEHGKYPNILDDLTPDYLKKIPNDRFASGGPYKYESTGRSYILYSVGPDGKDDGGKPVRKDQYRFAKGDLTVECK